MPQQYLVLATALARSKERSGAADTDDEFLTEVLEMSAGTDSLQVTHYRPFYTAAKWIEQNQPTHLLAKADGATFTGLMKPIDSLLQMQRAYDLANGLDIPDGFEAVPSDCDRCDSGAPGPTSRYYAAAVGTTISP